MLTVAWCSLYISWSIASVLPMYLLKMRGNIYLGISSVSVALLLLTSTHYLRSFILVALQKFLTVVPGWSTEGVMLIYRNRKKALGAAHVVGSSAPARWQSTRVAAKHSTYKIRQDLSRQLRSQLSAYAYVLQNPPSHQLCLHICIRICMRSPFRGLRQTMRMTKKCRR
jgi:hypothetical protein